MGEFRLMGMVIRQENNDAEKELMMIAIIGWLVKFSKSLMQP